MVRRTVKILIIVKPHTYHLTVVVRHIDRISLYNVNRPPNRIASIQVGSRANQLTNRLLSMQGMDNGIPAETAENSHICAPPGASLLDCFRCLVEDAHKADRAGSDAMRRRNHAPPWAQARERKAGIMDGCQAIFTS